MIEKAIEKLKEEMEKDKASYVQVVGQFLLTHLEHFPLDAEKILVNNKTISKSLTAMRKEAEKQKVGNCAVLSDQEGFNIVLKYFGIESEPVPSFKQQLVTEVKQEKSSINFGVSLDDYL